MREGHKFQISRCKNEDISRLMALHENNLKEFMDAQPPIKIREVNFYRGEPGRVIFSTKPIKE